MSNYVIDRKKWAKMTIFEQMGNIYSEVGRAIKAKKAGRLDDSEQAVVRALDLFNATAESLVRHKSPKTKEVLRAKEQFLQIIYDEHSKPANSVNIERYFQQFAIAARLNR